MLYRYVNEWMTYVKISNLLRDVSTVRLVMHLDKLRQSAFFVRNALMYARAYDIHDFPPGRIFACLFPLDNGHFR